MIRTMYGMMVQKRNYNDAIGGNVRRKTMAMRRKARVVPNPLDLEATSARFTRDVLERVQKEASISSCNNAFS